MSLLVILESKSYEGMPYYARSSNVFDELKGECESNEWQAWLGSNSCTDCYILFDLQVVSMITTVIVKQSNHYGLYLRGTANFDIHVGNTTDTMILATQGTMLNVNTPRVDCLEIPLQKFHVGYIARYLKFTATSHYDASPALKYIKFE